MSLPVALTDSKIVMAELSSHDVVNQTLSGGEPSLSDVPASTNDKKSAGGDAGEIQDTATATHTETNPVDDQGERKTESAYTLSQRNDIGKDAIQASTDSSKHGPGPVETRVLEMNGVASASDGGDDTASLGGSESDASRTESRVHSRSTSTKRPTSFKPVSFAKFSVPKAPGTSPTMKPAEKAPSTSGTPLGTPIQSLRPRLVAKTTSLRDPLSKTGIGARPGAGPDPNQVWNKNRPVQQTPPKHLTDEELKQQYGIHMTSRIQEDGGGTESKWADIDDDEEDWAPETIEWTDGTKTNLTQVEPPPITNQDVQPPEFKDEVLPPRPDVTSVPREMATFAPKPTTLVGPNPTVLRLGANAERQARSASIMSKGSNEKSPSLSASPAPAKSPWATLPPVEKTSPVISQVQLQPPMRNVAREPHQHVYDGYSGVVPPKEIAADDFNRSWKEIQSGTRELYNSRSGRYEPVSETRKGTWRTEQHFRTPSLLQRPASGEHGGPAEPSPAFQTHRSSGHDGAHWTRRRTSSNVSGGSGSFGRRLSISRPDIAQKPFETRRGSQANGMIEPPMFGREHGPPKEARDPSPSRRIPGVSRYPHGPPSVHENAGPPLPPPSDDAAAAAIAAATAGAQPAVPQAPQEDAVVMQERIMKEKRMEARQRRIEQEEKEEAAKRERIRQKLEALGPVPDKSKARKDSIDAGKIEATSPSTTALSPPKPPVPEPTGEPKQYGMMKVHHPDTVKKFVERDRNAEKSVSMPHSRRAPSPAREPKPEPSTYNGLPQHADSETSGQEKVSEAQADEQSSQWRGPGINVSGPYTTWSSNPKLVGASPALSNPWKPLSNDKTLGNGIFEQGLGGFQARDISLRNLGLDQSSVTPASQPFSAPSRSPQESASLSPLPSPGTRHVSYEALNPISRPAPIGPPSSQSSHWQPDHLHTGTAAWNNFHAVATKREVEENEKLRHEMPAIRDGPASLQVNFNETWRQVRTGEQAGQRQIVGISRSADGNAPIAKPLPGFDHPVSSLPFTEAPTRPLVSVPARSSRFFPQATEVHKKPAVDEGDYTRSPSPPPPEEMSNHPVYTGDSHRPLVHLPGPKPIVKLPPKAVASPQPPPTFASMAAAPPRVAPVSTATSWQEKINTLFGKKTVVPEKKNSLAVSSASKEPLDVQLHIAAVSVSLPQYEELPMGDGELTAKQVEEAEQIFEDREIGSLPVVQVPASAPAAAWHAAPPPSQSRLRSKNLKSMQVHSVEPFFVGFYDKDSSGNYRVSIRLPGETVAKTMVLQRKSGGHPHRPRGPSGYKPRKNTKPRDTGSSNPKKPASSQQANGNSSPRHPSRNASWGPRSFSGSR
ncbi:hypothetical protein FE257_010649 [Aspergillus nanangensis]|uniref:Uncharacterized protein n=1 Tax=Aspergillus nanangensis TaxID=2582783 RepID=A0AAD4CIW4_ASPNN|nr:hypothetical protein FE257_010649 [Aspergillus nanangensis]